MSITTSAEKKKLPVGIDTFAVFGLPKAIIAYLCRNCNEKRRYFIFLRTNLNLEDAAINISQIRIDISLFFGYTNNIS